MASATLTAPSPQTRLETPSRSAVRHRLARLACAEAELHQADEDRLVLRRLIQQASEQRDTDRAGGADPVVLCHHAELLSLLVRRLAETELGAVRARLDAERLRSTRLPRQR